MNENDGRFPDDSAVETPFPLHPAPQRQPGQSMEEYRLVVRANRETWPWLAATVEQQCGPDEWLVTIEDRRAATLEDWSPAPDGTADEDLLYPQAYRDASEIRKPQDSTQGGTGG